MRSPPSWRKSQTECVTLAARCQRQGAADAKTLTLPCAGAPRAEPEQLSERREEIQTYTGGRGKREMRQFVGDWSRCAPAGIIQDYFILSNTKYIQYQLIYPLK